MTTKRYRLTDMDLDEISLVPSGDDPEARVTLAKSAPVTESDSIDLDQIRAHMNMIKISKCKIKMHKMNDELPEMEELSELQGKKKSKKSKKKKMD